MQLRQANINDLNLLRRWNQQLHMLASISDSNRDWEKKLMEPRDWHQQLIAEIDGKAIGFIQIINLADEENHYWRSSQSGLQAIDIWTDELANPGNDHATSMMQTVLRQCFTSTEIKAVLTNPLIYNQAAHRFCEHLGFELLERRFFADHDCLVYQLTRMQYEAYDPLLPTPNFNQLLQLAANQRHRLSFILRGDKNWCTQQISWLLRDTVGCTIPGWKNNRFNNLTNKQAQSLLGQEFNAVAISTHEGLDPDLIAALSGTVIAGGLFILCLPDKESIASDGDNFLKRIDADLHAKCYWQHHERVQNSFFATLLWIQGSPIRWPKPSFVQQSTAHESTQHQAIIVLQQIMCGQRKRPIVLLADRGRGKSAALGMAAARLMQEQEIDIVLTAMCRAAVTKVFQHAQQLLTQAVMHRDTLCLHHSSLRYLAPDSVSAKTNIDCLLVDEAAVLPLPLLTQWMQKFPRLIFASTVHGYEGAGRGFELKFFRLLDEYSRGWRLLRLTRPMRFAMHDPVEQFLNRLLLLDAEADKIQHFNLADCSIEWLQQSDLAADESLLRSVFGLLLQAHYRTRPFDLRLLLDAPRLLIVSIRHQVAVVAVAIVSVEGNLDEALAQHIQQGKRRLRSHSLPQTITAYSGELLPLTLHAARIQRIAVVPELQRCGLGNRLLQAIRSQAIEKSWDYIGTLFGYDEILGSFWHNAGYRLVALGSRLSSVSGNYGSVMLMPISTPAKDMLTRLRQDLARKLPHMLRETLDQFTVQQTCWALQDLPIKPPSAQVLKDVSDFVHGHREYETLSVSLHTQILYAASGSRRWCDARYAAAIIKCIQGKSWNQTAAATGISGRKSVIKRLREILT